MGKRVGCETECSSFIGRLPTVPRRCTEQLFDLLLLLLLLPFVIFEGFEDFVGRAAEDVAGLIFQSLLDEGEKHFVRLTSLLSLGAVDGKRYTCLIHRCYSFTRILKSDSISVPAHSLIHSLRHSFFALSPIKNADHFVDAFGE